MKQSESFLTYALSLECKNVNDFSEWTFSKLQKIASKVVDLDKRDSVSILRTAIRVYSVDYNKLNLVIELHDRLHCKYRETHRIREDNSYINEDKNDLLLKKKVSEHLLEELALEIELISNKVVKRDFRTIIANIYSIINSVHEHTYYVNLTNMQKQIEELQGKNWWDDYLKGDKSLNELRAGELTDGD